MTDKKRIEILEKVKERIANLTEIYICNAIKRQISYKNDMFLLFPELLKHKPKGAWNVWWDSTDKEIRIKVLNSMIKEIKAKSNG